MQPAPSPESISESRRWLNRGSLGIGLASLFSDLGHEVPTSLLPVLVTSTLGAPAAALGLIEGVADALAGLARLGGGVLADDPDRRKATAVGGYISTALLSSLIGVAVSLPQVALLRAGAWFSRGLRVPARNALLADMVPSAAYGRAYGFERAMDNLGAIGGPLLALALVASVGVRWAIVLSVIPGLIAAGSIVLAIRSAQRPAPRPRQKLQLAIAPVLRGRLGGILASVAALELGHVAATLLILRAGQGMAPEFGSKLAAEAALVLYAGYNAVATGASLLAGRLADRRGNLIVLLMGGAVFVAAYLVFAVPPSLASLAAAFALAGVGIACLETAENATVATLAQPEVRGSAFGLLAGIQAFGNLGASGVMGLLWTLTSPQLAFVYVAGWTLISTASLVFVVRRNGNP